jgi:hypothetical protein
VGVVVAKRKKFFVALLQGLEPRQLFIDRDLSHRCHLRRGLKTADDDDGIVVETLSSESSSRGGFGHA